MDNDDEPDTRELVREHTALLVVLDRIDDDPARADYADPASAAADSTVELRGVVVPPTELFWRFSKPPATIDGPELGRTSWEIERFCALGLAADPDVLTALTAPRVVRRTSIGAELRELTRAFLSQRAADPTAAPPRRNSPALRRPWPAAARRAGRSWPR